MSQCSLSGRGQGHVSNFYIVDLEKFRHSKSSVYRWYPQLVRGRFVYDTYRTMEATRSRHGWVQMFITHRPTVILQLHNFDLFRTCRTSCFYTVAWQLARFQLTRRIARSLGDSWASYSQLSKVADFNPPRLHLTPPLGVTLVEFRRDLWHRKTRVPELPCGFVCVILCVAVLVEHRLVTDTDTDRHRRTQGHSIYRAIIASRGKNWMFMVYNSTNERVGWVRTTSSEVKHAYCIRRKCTV